MSEELELKQGFITPDGKVFDTKAQAQDHLRRPKVFEAMMKITGDNEDLANWIIDSAADLEDAHSTGTIRRVTKSDRTKYEKALEHAASLNDPKLAFLVENKTDLINGFRWPKVERMDEADKASAVKAALMTLTEDNEEISDFLIEQREAIVAALDTGKVKKEVNPKAAEGLARWRAEQAALRAAASAPEESAGEKPKAPAKKK